MVLEVAIMTTMLLLVVVKEGVKVAQMVLEVVEGWRWWLFSR